MEKQYECLLIINGSLSDEEQKKTADTIKRIFSKHKAKVLKKEEWGRKKLGYPIKKSKLGVYFLFYIEINTDAIAELRTLFGYEENILKNVFFQVDDWKKEFEYYQKLKENPQLNVEKLVPNNKE
jgi:small subunit ribosomal protein S6